MIFRSVCRSEFPPDGLYGFSDPMFDVGIVQDVFLRIDEAYGQFHSFRLGPLRLCVPQVSVQAVGFADAAFQQVARHGPFVISFTDRNHHLYGSFFPSGHLFRQPEVASQGVGENAFSFREKGLDLLPVAQLVFLSETVTPFSHLP